MRSPIAHIVLKHPEVFKQHYDSEYLMLASFILHEFLKGEDSFWYPYLEIINFSDIPMLWNADEIEELQDQILKKDIKHYRDEFEDEWSLIFNCLKKNGYTKEYPGIDDPEKEPELKRLFTKAFVSVVTRCFGWGLPRTSMIPFADCINHHNVDSTYELIHRHYHLAAEDEDRGPHSYYSQSKVEGDYTDFFNLD